MRLATFLTPDGTEHAGEVRGETVVAFTSGSVLDRLASGDTTPADGEEFALSDVTLLAPLRPRAIFGIGLNYLAHARETGQKPPEAPIVFMKLPTSSVGPAGPVRCPAVVTHGPHGQNVSAPFARVHCRSRFCRSRAETSSATA